MGDAMFEFIYGLNQLNDLIRELMNVDDRRELRDMLYSIKHTPLESESEVWPQLIDSVNDFIYNMYLKIKGQKIEEKKETNAQLSELYKRLRAVYLASKHRSELSGEEC